MFWAYAGWAPAVQPALAAWHHSHCEPPCPSAQPRPPTTCATPGDGIRAVAVGLATQADLVGAAHGTAVRDTVEVPEYGGTEGALEPVDSFLELLNELNGHLARLEYALLDLKEALASGVPVVQPRHAAFPEILADTGGGLLYDPDDPEGLADALNVGSY